jgi:hypothetical protein
MKPQAELCLNLGFSANFAEVLCDLGETEAKDFNRKGRKERPPRTQRFKNQAN